MARRVVSSSNPVICGVGAITGYGWGKKHLWDGLVTGESAVRLQPGFGSVFDRDEIWLGMIPDELELADGRPPESKFSRALHAAARAAVTSRAQGVTTGCGRRGATGEESRPARGLDVRGCWRRASAV